jgi:putative protease
VSSGRVELDFTPNPYKTFNRGYTTYFLSGKADSLTAWDSPKSLGEPVGAVAQLTQRSFSLNTPVEIHRGDGLCFLDANRQLCGTIVNDVQGQVIFPAKMEGLSVGAQVYRNHDHVFMAAMDKSSAARKIDVQLHLTSSPNELHLAAADADGNQASYSIPYEFNPAEKPEMALANIEKQLRKLGGTDYTCSGVSIEMDPVQFVPAALLNGLRRGALEALEAARDDNRPCLDGETIEPNAVPFPTRELSFEGNILNHCAERFYRRHGVIRIEPAAESGLDMKGRKVMTTRYCIKQAAGACPKQRSSHLKEPLTLIDEEGNRFPLHFNCDRFEMEVFFKERST